MAAEPGGLPLEAVATLKLASCLPKLLPMDLQFFRLIPSKHPVACLLAAFMWLPAAVSFFLRQLPLAS